MVKKVILLSSVLFGLLFLGIAEEDMLDETEQLEQAQTHLKNGQYRQAEEIYQQILTDYPGTDLAFKAQKYLVIVYVAMDRQPKAKTALTQLLTEFSAQERLPHSVHEIVERCCQSGKGEAVRQVHQDLLDAQPQSEHAIWLRMGVALSNAYLGDESNADSAIEGLTAGFSEDDRSAEAIGQIAWNYRKLKRYEKARQLYQYVVVNWPYKPRAVFSQRGVALCNIALGDETAARAAIEKLLADFSEDEHITEVISRIAYDYRRSGQYEKARELYQYALAHWPEDKYAIESLKGAVRSNIALGNYAAAEAGIDKLLAEFSEDNRIAEAAYKIAYDYQRLGRYEKARELYQYVLAHWPEDECAIESLEGVALSSIGLGDDPNTEAAIEQLISSFSGHKHLAEAIYQVARRLESEEKASVLYQYVIENCSDSKFAIFSKVKMGGIYIRLGEDATARDIFDRVFIDFSEHPDLPKAVSLMSYEYYKQAIFKESEGYPEQAREYFLKTMIECERIVTQFPEIPDIASESCYYLAFCHERLGRYIDAVKYYQMLLDNWPDYKYAWHALFRIGCGYETLKQRGLISELEADAIIEAVYEQLLETYPTCKVAVHARTWLSHHKPTNQGESR